MKAIVYENYGPPEVLQLREVDKPSPKEYEVLVKVFAASINYIDWQVLRGESLMLRLLNGLLKPKHNGLGDDLAGQVEAVGTRVKNFKPGDEVFGISDFDAFAEFACVPENALTLKPAGMTFEQAAAIPEAAITALQGIRNKCRIQPGKKALIIGASGGVGTYAVQIAKAHGANVTGVCSTRKIDLVRSIGADQVSDYKRENFTQNKQQYDLIFAVGGSYSIFDYHRALSPEGIYVCAGGSGKQYFQALLLGPLLSMTGGKKLQSIGMAKPNPKDYGDLIELYEAGKVIPVIDRCYPLDEVPEALRYYGSGQAHGKVIITVKQYRGESNDD